MTVGQTFATPRARFTDARTGREIWKLTCWDDSHCVGTYMYCQAISADERYAVFCSNRSGRYQLYRVEMAAGQTVQMTDFPMTAPNEGKDVLFWARFAVDGRHVVFREGQAIISIDVQTLQQRVVFHPQTREYDLSISMPNFSADGKQVLPGCRLPDGGLGILSVDLATGKAHLLYRIESPDATYVSHILGGTENGKAIATFVIDPDRQNKPDLSPAERARCWKLDPTTGKAEPFLIMPPGFRCTHEYWSGPGKSRLYYHRKTVPTWTPASIESIAGDGSDRQIHFTSDRKLGHSCLSPDGRWLVSDVQDPTGNELYLVDMKTGSAETLCWPDSTVVNGQIGHVHPSFSPTGRYVFYTSDHSGRAAVFLVPLH